MRSLAPEGSDVKWRSWRRPKELKDGAYGFYVEPWHWWVMSSYAHAFALKQNGAGLSGDSCWSQSPRLRNAFRVSFSGLTFQTNSGLYFGFRLGLGFRVGFKVVPVTCNNLPQVSE